MLRHGFPAASTASYATVLVAATAIALASCKPEIGAPPSLVLTPRLLAVMASPPEVAPGATIKMEALAAAPIGTLTTPIAWTVCKTPKAPAETSSVSRSCVVDQPDDDGAADIAPTALVVPSNACSLFGPIPPPVRAGQPAVRARDPDSTGGYYLPVRAAARGVTDPFGPLLGFAFVRISCGLANVGAATSAAFITTYRPNQTPALTGVDTFDELARPSTDTVPGGTLTLRAIWAPSDAETFPYLDPTTHALVDTRESMGLSWFTTGGELLHDRTGRDANDPETTSDNLWTAPTDIRTPTPFHLWVVLRDSRGASTYRTLDVTVTP